MPRAHGLKSTFPQETSRRNCRSPPQQHKARGQRTKELHSRTSMWLCSGAPCVGGYIQGSDGLLGSEGLAGVCVGLRWVRRGLRGVAPLGRSVTQLTSDKKARSPAFNAALMCRRPRTRVPTRLLADVDGRPHTKRLLPRVAQRPALSYSLGSARRGRQKNYGAPAG